MDGLGEGLCDGLAEEIVLYVENAPEKAAVLPDDSGISEIGSPSDSRPTMKSLTRPSNHPPKESRLGLAFPIIHDFVPSE